MSPEIIILIDRLGGACFFILGLIFFIFYKKVGKRVADFQYKFFKIKYPEKLLQIGYLLGGLVFMIFGVLAFFEKIKFRH